MNDDLKDILSNLNKDIEQEKLLQYLNRNMPDAEQHELEKQMNNDEFMNDAIEGLEQVKDKNTIPARVQQLNADLKKQLDKRKRKKEKRKIPSQYWTYIGIIVVLLLIIIGYLVVKRMQQG
jgi:ABC-type bacteriocin/lantibiotic exporter with double-glycine peptidase domain